jgi:hypothetical protein
LQIAKYFSSIGFSVDVASVKKVDKAIDHVENRLKKLGTFANKPITLSIGSFDVDQRRLNVALGTALDIASSRLVFEISRFAVDQMHLNRVMTAATIQASRVAGQSATIRPNVHVNGVVGGGRVSHVAGAVGGGLIGRGVSGLYGPALALGLGGYGLSALNQRNQEVVSAQLQSTAVVQQAGGSAQQGKDSFEYLRSEGQRIGYNYLDASGDYNKLISGLTGSGIGLKESQKVFSGFAELARVNKLDKTTQNRLFRALSQVAGKGKLMSEELTGQIAEALPGGTALFAQAYQAKIGGNKTGAEAIQQLLADMKKGKVTSDILTYAGAAASQRANQGGALGTASQASQAEQARYQNSVNDMAVLASGAGVEEGFARIFRTLTAGLSESSDLVTTLAEGFNEATKWADDLLLFPQSFVRALEGKDSLVADWLGIDDTNQLISDWKEIKGLWEQITAIKPEDTFGNFLPTIEATAREIAGIIGLVGRFKQWNDNASASADIVQADIASRGDGPVSNFFAGLGGSLAGLSAYISTPFDVQESNQYKDYVTNEYGRGAQVMKDQEQLKGISENFRLQNLDPLSSSQEGADAYNDALSNEFKGFTDTNKQSALEKAAEVTNNNTQSNQIDIVVNVDGSTLAGMDANAQAQAIGEAVANMFVQSFDQVNVQFPVKQ